MVTNPPYGERISTPNLLAFYKTIGDKLKKYFKDNEAWILSYRQECFEQIRLKPSLKVPLYNGSLECEFRKYCLFDGSFKDFRAEGGIVKTEEEKRQMAEKHRFRKNREFKKRIGEEEENSEQDIRSFKFLSLERRREEERRETEHKRFAREDKSERSSKRFDREERGGKKQYSKREGKGEGKPFGRNTRREGKFKKNFRGNDED